MKRVRILQESRGAAGHRWLTAGRRRLAAGHRRLAAGHRWLTAGHRWLTALGDRPWARRTGTVLGLLAVTAAGMVVGVLLAGRVSADVGPFHAQLAVTPSVHGGTSVAIPPL